MGIENKNKEAAATWGWNMASATEGTRGKPLGEAAAERRKEQEQKNKEFGWTSATPTGGGTRTQLREEARELGIDTKGMSSRELRNAIKETKSANEKIQEDMLEFITKNLEISRKQKEDVSPSEVPSTTTSRKTDDTLPTFKNEFSPTKGVTQAGEGSGGGEDPPPEDPDDPNDPDNPEDPDEGDFPPAGWQVLKVMICRENSPEEIEVITRDPFYEG